MALLRVSFGIISTLILTVWCNTDNININLGTYLTSHDTYNTIGDVAVSDDGTTWLAGSGSFQYGLKPNPVIKGSSTGFVLGMSKDQPHTLYQVGKVVNHVRIGPNNMLLVSGDFGLLAFDSSTGKMQWQMDAINIGSNCSSVPGATYHGGNCRIAVGSDGTSTALVHVGYWQYQIMMINSQGKLLANVTFNRGGHHLNDVAVLAKPKLVALTYFIQTHLPHGGPVQSPCILTFDYKGKETGWKTYCWSGHDLGQNQADSRGELLYMNDKDGYLYFGGIAYGGNTCFRFEGHSLKKKIDTVGYDEYTQPYDTGSSAITFISRMDPSNGKVLLGQFLLARLPKDKKGPSRGNSLSPRSLAADEKGRVYVAQSSACCIQDRANLTVNGKHTGPYGGDAAILVVSSDFKQRLHWNVFTADGGSTPLGVGVGGGVTSFIASTPGPGKHHHKPKKADFLTVKPWKHTSNHGPATPYVASWSEP